MKIVTLIPGATKMVCQLGLESSIVGVSHCCNTTLSVSSLPKVTHSFIDTTLPLREIDNVVTQAKHEGISLYQINSRLLKTLSPDLIITQGICDVCAVNTATVYASLLPIKELSSYKEQVISLSGTSFEGVIKDLQNIAHHTSKENIADNIINDLTHQWNSLNALPKLNKTIAFLEWSDPFFYGGHWIPEMIATAGGIDTFGQVGQDSGRCSTEDLLNKNPNIIIVGACGYGLRENISFSKTLIKNPTLSSLSAIKNNQVWAIDANNYCSSPTTKIVEGAKKIRSIMENNVCEGIAHI